MRTHSSIRKLFQPKEYIALKENMKCMPEQQNVHDAVVELLKSPIVSSVPNESIFMVLVRDSVRAITGPFQD